MGWKKCLLFTVLVSAARISEAQIIISLLLGDKLNTGKIEFGLDGGLTLSNIQGPGTLSHKRGFNLGFYFDFKMKNPAWMINTGVMVKSPMGARGGAIYPLGDSTLDAIFSGGSVETQLRYFHVPLMMKYQFGNGFFVKSGIMLGWLNKAYDEFIQSVNRDDDLRFSIKNRDAYHRIDAGLAFGAGYRLMKGAGMNLGVQYYVGLMGIEKVAVNGAKYNRGFFANIGIPIGKTAANQKTEPK